MLAGYRRRGSRAIVGRARPRGWAGRLALAAAAGVALTAPAAAGGVEIAEAWMRDLEALNGVNGIVAKHGAVRDGGDGRTVTEGIEFSWSGKMALSVKNIPGTLDVSLGVHWSRPSQTLNGLRESPTGYAADRIEVPEEIIEFSGAVNGRRTSFKLTQRAAVMQDVRWPRLPAIPDDADRPVSRLAEVALALVSTSYSRMSAASMEIVSEMNGLRTVKTIHDIRSLDVLEGSVAEEVSASTEVMTSKLPSGDGSGEAHLAARNGQTKTLRRDSKIPLRAFFGMPAETGESRYVDSETTEDLVEIDNGVTTRVAKSVSSGLELGAPDFPPAKFLDTAIVQKEVQIEDLVRTVLSVMSVVRLESARYENLQTDGAPNYLDGGTIKVDAHIAGVSLEGLSVAGADALELQGLTMMVPGTASLNLDLLSARNVRLPTLQAFAPPLRALIEESIRGDMARSQPSGPAVAAGSMGDKDKSSRSGLSALSTSEMIDLIPLVGEVQVRGFRVSPIDQRALELKALVARFAGEPGALPTEGRIDVSDLIVPRSSMRWLEMRRAMRRMDVDTLSLDAAIALKWDAATGAMTLDPLDVDAGRLGRFTGRLDLGNVPREAFTDPGGGAFATAIFRGMTLDYADAPALTRLFESYADDSGISAGQFIDAVLGGFEATLASKTGDAFAGKVRAAAETFFNDPKGSLHVEATPPAPVPLAGLLGTAVTGPAGLVDLLGLGVRAGRGL